jgi:hypothetical protein
MSGIASVIEELILATVFSEKVAVPRKNKTDWVLIALSVLFAGAGGVFLVLSLYRYLEGVYAPPLAALASASCLFLAAALPIFVRDYLRAKRVAPVSDARHPLAENLRVIIEAVCTELEEPIKENPKAAVLAAALAGFLASNNQIRL